MDRVNYFDLMTILDYLEQAKRVRHYQWYTNSSHCDIYGHTCAKIVVLALLTTL